MGDIFRLASPVLVMKLGSESLTMTSAKLNMAKTSKDSNNEATCKALCGRDEDQHSDSV